MKETKAFVILMIFIHYAFCQFVTYPSNVKTLCSEFKRLKYRKICKEIAGNPIGTQIGRMNNDTTDWLGVTVPKEVNPDDNFYVGIRESCSGCPEAKELINTLSPARVRTTSPWSYCLDFDVNRFPQYMNFGVCSCLHCFNYDTKSYDERILARNLTVKMPVLVKKNSKVPFSECGNLRCEKKLIDVPVGCFCELPPRWI